MWALEEVKVSLRGQSDIIEAREVESYRLVSLLTG